MKKRFLLTFLMVFLITGINAFAQKYEVSFDNAPKKIVIAERSEKLITDMKVIDVTKGQTSTEFETEAENFSAYLIYEDRIGKATVNKVTSEDKNENSTKDYPDIYERGKDAIKAIMVVNSVFSTYKDGEAFIEANVFLHGKEIKVLIPEDITIEYAPEIYKELEGESAYALKKGDIIKLRASFSGEIDGLSLIFRPTLKNPVFEQENFGSGFYRLFSDLGVVAGDGESVALTPKTGFGKTRYAYAYGVVTDFENDDLEIRDSFGETLSMEIADGAFVYVVNVNDRFDVSYKDTSSIRKGNGVIASIDEDGKFLGWADGKRYNLAFVRTVDKEVTEVVIYKNY